MTLNKSDVEKSRYLDLHLCPECLYSLQRWLGVKDAELLAESEENVQDFAGRLIEATGS